MERSESHLAAFQAKMRSAGLNAPAIRQFQHNYENLLAGQSGFIAEAEIQPIKSLPSFENIPAPGPPAARLLEQTVVLKLNGGLGTSMGLEKAKSLLVVKNGLTFLDFIARQILWARKRYNMPLSFLLMNSFSTSGDTLEFLMKYPELGAPQELELLQSQVPKVDAATLEPAAWPQNPSLEWCPPGHGDLYPSLLASGSLDRLLGEGVRYLFVSNSDNLGASLDLKLLNHFALSNTPFLMEVAERTASDRKGGHLAQRNGRFLLRESAQCAPGDQAAFQDIDRHRFFNTNNLWIRLDALKEVLEKNGGFIPLPLIRNAKNLDPRDKSSPGVFQLETAMGAAIESFERAGAIVVPRSRFAPVKTTSDLLALRSDAYEVTEDWRITLAQREASPPPAIDLDANFYKNIEQLEAAVADGAPSLKDCRELVVRGPVQFNVGVVISGKVTVENGSSMPRPLPPGEYRDRTVQI
jgi:UDP-N-acetylglucosamine pyrophosphorylase